MKNNIVNKWITHFRPILYESVYIRDSSLTKVMDDMY